MAGWVIALFTVMLLQVIGSVDVAHSWNVFVDRVFKFALFGFLIASFVTSPAALRLFLFSYLLAFAKMTQEGLLGYITGSMVWENQGVPRLHGTTPIYGSPNSLGGTQSSTLPFVWALWKVAPTWAKACLAALGFGALAVTVFTGSRTAYVALLAWLAYMVYRSRYRFRTAIVTAVAACVILPFIPADYIARFQTIYTRVEIEGSSMDTRVQIWRDAKAVFLSHPLGVGVGAFPSVREESFGRSQDTHSLYLEIATNLGVPGIIVFFGLIMTFFRNLIFVRRRATAAMERLAAVSEGNMVQRLRLHSDFMLLHQVAVGLTGFIIVRLVLGLFGHDLYEIYWWFTAGLAAALVQILRVTEHKAERLINNAKM